MRDSSTNRDMFGSSVLSEYMSLFNQARMLPNPRPHSSLIPEPNAPNEPYFEYFAQGNIPEPKPKAKPKPQKLITWDDVVGLEDAKAALKEAIEAPALHKDVYDAFHIAPPKGVLLWGPPGNGKTLLGKACATAMATAHKKEYKDGFYYYNGAECFGRYVGDESAFVRKAFSRAQEFKLQNGYPAILFFDEADSMLPRREYAPPWSKEAVNQFLSLMDGFEECPAFVILATNNQNDLDDAAIRAGRIDRKIYIGPPSRDAVATMLRSSFSKKPMQEEFIEEIVSELYSESKFVGERQFSDFLNGANVVAVSDRAASLAFRRAMAAKAKGETPSLFVTRVDAIAAIAELFREITEMVTAAAQAPKMQVNIHHSVDMQGGKENEPYL